MTPADPLAQLRDIHLPEPVSAWPPGPGWWVLAGLLVLTLLALAFWLWRRHQQNAWRRSAHTALSEAHSNWQENGDPDGYLQHANVILKRAALVRFPREDVASLSCERWDAFLDRQWRQPPAAGFSELGFGLLAYKPGASADIDQVHRLCQRWVSQVEGVPC